MTDWAHRIMRLEKHLVNCFSEGCLADWPMHKLIDCHEIEILKQKYSDRIPQSLTRFYANCGGKLSFSFAIDHEEDIGGIFDFAHPLNEGLSETLRWQQVFDKPFSDFGCLLKNAMSFCSMGNGDLLAFDMRILKDEPEIIYLDHESTPEVSPYPTLGRTFDEFMYEWERLCFLDPLVLIENMATNGNGYINHKTDFGQKVRRILNLDLQFFD